MPISSTIDAHKVSKVLFKAKLYCNKFVDVCMLLQVDEMMFQVDEVVLQVDEEALQVVQNPKSSHLEVRNKKGD